MDRQYVAALLGRPDVLAIAAIAIIGMLAIGVTAVLSGPVVEDTVPADDDIETYDFQVESGDEVVVNVTHHGAGTAEVSSVFQGEPSAGDRVEFSGTHELSHHAPADGEWLVGVYTNGSADVRVNVR